MGLMDDLLSEFIAETRETLEALSGEIIAWEADPQDRARLDAVFRFVHTVKGSCGFLELPRLERLSHAAEDVLSALRAGTRGGDAALVTAVLAVIDRIGEHVDALEAGTSLSEDEDDQLIAALADAGRGAQPAAQAVSMTQASRAATRSIRVPLDLLDRIMSGVSDMVLARNELSRRLRDLGAEDELGGAFERLSGCIADMRDAVTRTRMQRIEKLFSALPRLVRDTAAELGKPVDLEIDGGDVELDREMIELIRDPLTHMVRNAIDHGLEPPTERRRRGKPPVGRLAISARQSGNQIVIEVADDGNGIDEARIVAKAVAAGIVTPEAAEQMSAAARLALVFSPGLSTAEQVTALSGRGVGMDVVKSNIERIGGSIELDNRPRVGLRAVIRVPLTLTIIATLTVSAGGQCFAIPRAAIDEIVRASSGMIRIDSLGNAGIVTIRGRAMPLVHLEQVLGMGPVDAADGRTLVVIRAGAGCTYALCVEAVHDHEELVIKPASPPIAATGVYAGKSLPDSGVPMLLLDMAGIAARAGVAAEDAAAALAAPEADEADTHVSNLLFRDLDGRVRAIRLAVVERVEDVPIDQIRFTAGRMRVAIGDRLLPLAGLDAAPAGETLKLLRLHDGARDLAYAIDDVIDIVRLPPDCQAAGAPGPVAGVVLAGGEQIELLDPFWLFAAADADVPPPRRPVCLLPDREDLWTREILRPLVEAAGYRVAFQGDSAAEEPAVIIALEDGAEAGGDAGQGAAPVVRLTPDRQRAGGDRIYRYDRVALLAAIERIAAERG
jgi:two-component system chemotaxis sensor kinase CheA